MPNCKDEKDILSRFKVESLIRSKCHLDFHKKYVVQGVPCGACYSIESSQSFWQDFFSSNVKKMKY